MREPNLSNKEIRDLWRNRTLREKSMILCLSQLEACEYQEMRDRVETLGLIGKGEFTQYKRNKSDYAEKEYNTSFTQVTFPQRKWGKEEIQEVFRMRRNGFSAKEIAQILGRTCGSINKCVHTYKEKYE